MKKKVIGILIIIALIMGTIPMTAFADYSLPTTFGAPQDFTVHYYMSDGLTDPWNGFEVSVSASNELRSFLDEVAGSSSAYTAAGYTLSDLELQLDYKLDNGSWHYTSDWDNKLDWMSNMSSVRLSSGQYSASTVFLKGSFEYMWPEETFPESNSFFDNHSMTLRARFIVSSKDAGGNDYRYASAWSSDYVFNNKPKAAVDPAKLINHAPVLKSAEIRKLENGSPYLHIVTDPAHADLRSLNSLSNDGVKTELWIKVGNGPWQTSGLNNFVEQFDTPDMVAFFGQQDSYDAVVFEVKVRYCFDLYHYPGTSPTSQMIYSPFSNVMSHGLPAYTGATQWATEYLDQAAELGLITERLQTKKMSGPITREEFAEIAVKFYEMVTGKTAALVDKTFKDTTNPEIIKAFGLNITTGVGDGTRFEPNSFLSRQQMAAMITRTLKACYPNIFFDINGQPDFKDQKLFASYAITPGKFMAKYKITVGDGKGSFDPVGNCTREQALTFLVRAFNYKTQYVFK